MNTSPKALAVIPGRGGSKRLPRKNILPVAGHPLIAHTIMAAARANSLTDWLVSSEDEEILDIARQYDAPVPFVRPSELSGDEIRNIEVVAHALQFMEKQRGFKYDIIVLLQPTCPVRDPQHIDTAVSKLFDSSLDTLASVKGPYKKRDPILKGIRNGILEPFCDGTDPSATEPFFLYNASIYAARRGYFVREKRLISEQQIPLEMDKMHSIDVDEIEDLVVAEAYLQSIKNK